MVIVGGAGTLLGPVVGVVFFIILQNYVSSYTERWQLIMGIIFVAFVLYGRGGIVQLVSSLWEKRPGKGEDANVAVENAKKISKSFKALQVLKDVSLEVQENERHVIIGPNGAGKTTLFNCLTGFLPISSGKIFLQNQDISTMETHKRVGLGMSRTFQKNNLFWNLTVKENVYLAITSNKPYKYRFF